MNTQNILSKLWLPALGLALFLTAVICRPLIPIDETRYMSVAWEMSLHHGWLDPLTKNFEAYSHKPPLLFWLINVSWAVFGISRWAGAVPIVMVSVLCIYLTGLLGKQVAKTLSQDNPSSPLLDTQRSMMVMAAAFPFMLYGTLIMFDFLVCVFVLLSLILVLKYSETRRLKDLVLLGVCLGLGVLAKGPVAYLYVLPCYLLAPVWKRDLGDRKSWYLALLGAILVSAVPVLFWLIPVLQESDNKFAFWLLWNQTAGRVTGNFSEAHVRPFYFYLPLLPALILPWILFPSFWKSISSLKATIKTDNTLRFLACFFIPVFIAFSLISGKQPHYLVPLVPALALFVVMRLEHIQTKTMARTLAAVAFLFIAGQVVAKHYFLEKYDLTPIVNVMQANPDKPFAYVSNYHAELNFLARRTTKVEDVKLEDLDAWFVKHPDGLAIMKFEDTKKMPTYTSVFHMNYRGRHMGVFRKITAQDKKE